LTERRHSVPLAHLVRFAGEIERVAGFAGEYQVECFAVILVDGLRVERLLMEPLMPLRSSKRSTSGMEDSFAAMFGNP
jgi:hypothetical protein